MGIRSSMDSQAKGLIMTEIIATVNSHQIIRYQGEMSNISWACCKCGEVNECLDEYVEKSCPESE